MEWKIKRDPYFSALYEKTDLKFIEDCGFFFDSSNEPLDIRETLDIKCTPFYSVVKRAKESKNPCVIISTGSFCPVHKGHIEMMEKAREACEKAGYDVVGGYLAPDHDEYVLSKVPNGPNIYERISLLHKMTRTTGWLFVDPWAGVFAGRALNFTDVYLRLELYLEKISGMKIPVFFVCGGDRGSFSWAFHESGRCVIVGRPEGFNEPKRNINWSKIDGKRILYIHHDNPLSSTEVRKNFKKPSLPKKLVLRVEDEDPRRDQIISLLRQNFEDVEIHYLEEQKKVFDSLSNLDLISVDSLLESKYNLSISRSYDAFGIDFIEFGNRPGSLPIKEQLNAIPRGSYFIFDDDIHVYGSTMAFAQKMIKENGLGVKGIITLIKSGSDEEILDCRDFYYGDQNSGLVMKELDGTLCRAPYVYPFACPYIRASIKDPLEFSIRIWKINAEYHKERDPNKFKECEKHLQNLKLLRNENGK